MENENPAEIAEIAAQIRVLGTLPCAGALPDPDWLWVRARIAAREESAVNVMRMWMTRLIARQLTCFGLL
jgi:hypothetical protein